MRARAERIGGEREGSHLLLGGRNAGNVARNEVSSERSTSLGFHCEGDQEP